MISASAPPSRSIKRTIRVLSAESAFVYCILESHEGIASYSTLPHVPGDRHRDLELRIPPGFEQEVEEVLSDLGVVFYEIS